MVALRAAPGRLPRGQRVYAIGDVHGCDRQLGLLHADIAADLRARPVGAATIVHLGDYVDRGPDSAAVLDRLLRGPPAKGTALVNLMGNHDRTAVDALSGDRAAATDWLFHDGRTTLASWGIGEDVPREAWRQHVPAAHVAFLTALPLSWRAGDYLFVHAGVRPGIALDAQDPEDLMRIRQPFLSWEEPFGAVVVHGHTPVSRPVLRDNRINVDTGAAIGGKLTCVVLEGDRVGFLQA